MNSHSANRLLNSLPSLQTDWGGRTGVEGSKEEREREREGEREGERERAYTQVTLLGSGKLSTHSWHFTHAIPHMNSQAMATVKQWFQSCNGSSHVMVPVKQWFQSSNGSSQPMATHTYTHRYVLLMFLQFNLT